MYCTRGGDTGMFHLVPFLSTGRRGSVTAEEWISLVRVLLLLSLIPALWFGVIPVTRPEVAPIVVLFGAYVIFLALGSHRLALLHKTDLVITLDLLVTALGVLLPARV